MNTKKITVTIANRDNAKYQVATNAPLLETLRAQGVDLPYGCKYGGCITCAAKLKKGKISQKRQTALNNRQLNEGYIILCVAHAIEDIIIDIGVESHDKLYQNPFLNKV